MKIHKIIFIAVLLMGVYFRGVEYFSAKSFWFDEAKTAMKIRDNSFVQLLDGKTITKHQPYPAGFLFITKAFSRIGGDNEFALRLFPFICGIVALFLFYRVAYNFLGPGKALLAVSFFSLSPNLIYYSSELKPYSSDVLFTVIFLGLFLNISRRRLSWIEIILYGLLGGLAIWVSYATVFLIIGMGMTVLISGIIDRDKEKLMRIVLIAFFWVVSFLLFYLFYVRYFTRDDLLVNYWRVAYMPANILSCEFIKWFIGSLSHFFKINLKFPVSLSALVLSVGGATLYKAKKSNFFLLVSPIIVVILGSALKMYPFQGRVIMFLVPIFMLLIVQGVFKIAEGVQSDAKSISILLIIFFLYYPVVHTLRQWKEPYGKSEIKPVMGYLAAHRQEGDVMYLYYSSRVAFEYYADKIGLTSGNYVFGVDSRIDFTKYKSDLEKLRGISRVWVVFSDVYVRGDGGDERKYFLEYLDEIGKKLDSYEVHIPPYSPPAYLNETFSAGLFLYDLCHVKGENKQAEDILLTN